MYAVIETGGKQYRVSPGQTVEVELLPAEPGATVNIERVLLISADGRTLVGQPTVPGGNVVATVAREGRGKKIIVFKYKSKKRYRRKTGHRQNYTYLTITDIQAEGESLVPDEERKRYETLSSRAARRYQAKLGLLGSDVAQQEEPSDQEAVDADSTTIKASGTSAATNDKAQTPDSTETPRTTRRRARAAEPSDEEPDESK